MPVVTVNLWSGRTKEQKARIIRSITKALEDEGIPKEATTVIINDVEKSNWGVKGEPAE